MNETKLNLRMLVLAFGALVLASEPKQVQAQGGPLPVDVASPLQREVVDYDVYTGRFEAVQQVELRARVTGYLDKVTFEDGDVVDNETILFTIDPRTFQASLNRADAALTAAKAARDLAQIEFDRAQQLAQRNVGTRQEVDRTLAALAEAEAQVGVSEAEVQSAQLELEFTEIRAPFEGRMSDSAVDPGNLVVGGAGNATILSTIVSIDPVHFVFTASEADFLRYSRRFQASPESGPDAQALPIGVRLMDEADFRHKGTIDFVDNRLDPNSGTISVRAVIPNPEGFLRPGVFGRIRVPATEPYQALLIPDTAILSDQNRKIVMLADAEGNVSARPVILGDMEGGLRIVKSGLSPDDTVVVNGIQRARPGGKVVVQTVELSLAEE
ncbi:MAG: efflux RND transporter periplasmic adaptor subunit [Pseudomonadota bacterium]